MAAGNSGRLPQLFCVGCIDVWQSGWLQGTPVDYHSYFVLDVLMSGRVDGCRELR